MDNDHVNKDDDVKPQFGEHGLFCVELFCGTGNLTYAMKHFFPDSFGIGHKVTKQKVKIVCLDLTKEDHQAFGGKLVALRPLPVGALRSAVWDGISSQISTIESQSPWPSTAYFQVSGWHPRHQKTAFDQVTSGKQTLRFYETPGPEVECGPRGLDS